VYRVRCASKDVGVRIVDLGIERVSMQLKYTISMTLRTWENRQAVLSLHTECVVD
jgi:hypothetical protein